MDFVTSALRVANRSLKSPPISCTSGSSSLCSCRFLGFGDLSVISQSGESSSQEMCLFMFSGRGCRLVVVVVSSFVCFDLLSFLNVCRLILYMYLYMYIAFVNKFVRKGVK